MTAKEKTQSTGARMLGLELINTREAREEDDREISCEEDPNV